MKLQVFLTHTVYIYMSSINTSANYSDFSMANMA